MQQPPETPPEGMLEVGRVAKAHGLRGEVLVELTSDRPERRAVGAVFTSSVGPLEVVESRQHQTRWLIRFRGYDQREQADALRGTVLFSEPLDATEGVLWVHELVGCRVVETDGTDRGSVVSVISNPASDLLELDSGALVPVTFVVDGPTEGVVEVTTPAGLFEL